MNYIDAVTKLVIEKLNEQQEDNRQRYLEDTILFDNLYALD